MIISNFLQAINPKSSTLPSVITVARKMLKSLSARFKFILDPNDQGFDGILPVPNRIAIFYIVTLQQTSPDVVM